jgi:hypothetical protein
MKKYDNTFLFGSGADNNYSKKVPLGNELLIKILNNLEKTKKLIYENGHLYNVLYNSLKKNIEYDRNQFYSLKNDIRQMINEGIKNNEKGIRNTLKCDMDFVNIGNETYPLLIGKSLLTYFDGKHDENDKNDKIDENIVKFLFSIFVNILGEKIVYDGDKKVKEISKNILNTLKKDENDVELDKITENIEFPIYFNPEETIIKSVIYLIKKENLKEKHKVIFNLISNLLDYTVIFDNNYTQIINFYKKSNRSKILKSYHFLLTMHYTFKELSIDERDIKNNNYYSQIKNSIYNNNYYITLNYTNYISNVLEKNINYIHGNLNEFINLKNRDLIKIENYKNSKKSLNEDILIPNFVPQSSLKPILSLEMLERLINSYKILQETKNIFIIGFGFNNDDSHIIHIIKKGIEKNNTLKNIIFIGDKSSYEKLEALNLKTQAEIYHYNYESDDSDDKIRSLFEKGVL